MKAFLRAHLPWAARQSLRCLRQIYGHRKPPFAGVYDSFRDIGPTPGAFESQDWATAGVTNVRKLMDKWQDPIPENFGFSKALLPLIASAIATDTGLRILDFGGAAGLDYANLVGQTGAQIKVNNYHVVDVPAACTAGRDVWAKHQEVTFSTSLPDHTERFDIVYSYSSVQYIERPLEFLKELASFGAKAILLCKHPVWTGPSFVRQQTNLGKGREVAHWVLNLDEITRSVPGYGLCFRGWHEDDMNVDNYPREYQVGRTTNLLFMKQPDTFA